MILKSVLAMTNSATQQKAWEKALAVVSVVVVLATSLEIFSEISLEILGVNAVEASGVQTSSTIWRFLLKKPHLGIRPKLIFPEWKPAKLVEDWGRNENPILKFVGSVVAQVSSESSKVSLVSQQPADLVVGRGKLSEILVEPVVEKSVFLKQGPFESTFLQA